MDLLGWTLKAVPGIFVWDKFSENCKEQETNEHLILEKNTKSTLNKLNKLNVCSKVVKFMTECSMVLVTKY